MTYIYTFFLTFIIYSFIGWVYEDIYVLFASKKLVNRGFLFGPIIPIYGFGSIFICMITEPVRLYPFYVFLGSMVTATFIEYITSFLMEKFFHTRWWDYSNMKFNMNGRVCLPASLFWGVCGIVVVDVLQPFVNHIIESVPVHEGRMITVVIFVILVIDIVITSIGTLDLDRKLYTLTKFKQELGILFEGRKIPMPKNIIPDMNLKSLPSDLQEKVSSYLKEHHIQLDIKPSLNKFTQKRLMDAFPNMKSKRGQLDLQRLKEVITKISIRNRNSHE